MVRTIQEIIQEAYNEIPTITPAEAKEEQDNGALIIDTREINELVIEAIKINDAKSIKDMGKLMNYLKEKYPTNMDFSKASKIIKESLIQ